MKKLILTTSDSGAGYLKMAQAADKIVVLSQRLVWGPVRRVGENADLYLDRIDSEGGDGEHWFYWREWASPAIDSDPGQTWAAMIATCESFDTVEFWIDPLPNAQLVVLQVLAKFRLHAEVLRKLFLVHLESPLGENQWNADSPIKSTRVRVDSEHLNVAETSWSAYTDVTPEKWFDLLSKSLVALPYLRRSVLQMLEELPDAITALGATEMRLLQLISDGDVAPFSVFPGYERSNTLQVFGYWEIGRMLDYLAQGQTPAILGLIEGPFTLAMHENKHRYDLYTRSRLSLSTLGLSLIARNEDFSRHNLVNRWWGGTKLTNDLLWRWDALNNVLVAPA